MIFRWPVFLIEEAGVAGFYVTVGRHHLRRLGIVLEIAGKHARRLELHLAILGDANVDVGAGRPDCIGIDFAVRLGGYVKKGFGLPV